MSFSDQSSPYRIPADGNFDFSDLKTAPGDDIPDKSALKKALKKEIQKIDELQHTLYAEDKRAVLMVFQAMDAAGKDSTIRAVLSGVNPAGFQVFSFKQPSQLELDHDFLWRTHSRMPERGRIGVFNRSYYEEVLVVKVRPDYLKSEHFDLPEDMEPFWNDRYESINNSEKHLVKNGTVILKFFLNVSKDEQKQRFLSRIDNEHKNWKFSSSDLKERALWPQYQQAYKDLLEATSTDIAPWYAIPADNKPYMRLQVATILRKTLENMNPQFPQVGENKLERLQEAERVLHNEAD